MPRILPRGEIEGLDHTSIPRLRLPERTSLFKDRAQRLRQLATEHPAAGYLELLAHLADGQQLVLNHLEPAPLSPAAIDTAHTHRMPPLLASSWPREASWHTSLAQLMQHMLNVSTLPSEAQGVCQTILTACTEQPQQLEQLAESVLRGQLGPNEPAAWAPFVMAALQVHWTNLLTSLKETDIPMGTPFGVCPSCGTLPLSSIVRIGGRQDGCRYLCCPLCALEWHLVRVTCSHCESTKNIYYHEIEDGPAGIKAESCDHCHSYRKIFYQEKQLGVDPVADDLASLALDVLMGEEGYGRVQGNPLLWQAHADPDPVVS
ncbi:MAG TPA: formate dehydrogenase accessory protein FdhE [Candidatus Paenalcaligenes intestinipullorum]|uniref:Protein FdhE homolog n=1 Tax=Candidatus Paenalcaligenes intestinipullorum TaxID=2838718 RepID=A0A9D2ZPQ9_9BURK|nr:formate dehydrogenase accessory protein FdhE [Candidatus Paenalcaligenes intestinipullorum]